VLTKDLLRVSRAGGGYHLQFADADAERLAARVLGIYQGHVGESREMLETALADVEREPTISSWSAGWRNSSNGRQHLRHKPRSTLFEPVGGCSKPLRTLAS